MEREKECLICKKVFSVKRPMSPKAWGKMKFCSRECYYKSRAVTNKIQKVCVVCNQQFDCWNYRKATQKCCGKICQDIYKKSDEFGQTMRKTRLGKSLSEVTKQKLSASQKGKRTGDDNHLWKGEDVKYRALHDWIIRHRGKPDACEHCGTGSKDGKRLVWANKSHNYLRGLDDWMRLCYRCHRKYDFPNEKHR